jgi:hypothetical protein
VAYFVFNNDFSLHSNRELAVLQATAAHELFHAVQRNDYPWDDDILVPNARWDKEMWWFEATATWMEEVCQPNVDDYVSYVQEFLTRPEEPLTSADGLREYGAAIFPGYLFEYHGGPALWQSVFQDIFELGVEKAITSALKQLNDQASLDEVVSAFWSCAARPEAFWSDGAKFKSYSSPKLLRSVATLPLEISTTYETTPGRYGANLFQLPTKSGSVKIEMEASGSNDSAWMISFSKDGVMEPVVQELAAGDPPIVLDTAEQEISYLAVVNVSDREGYPTYRAVIEDPAPKAAPNADIGNSVGGGGGGGGCFISTAASGFSDIPFIARLFSKITKRAKKSERFDIQ